MAAGAAGEAIFVLGVTRRTGTNYVYDLVNLHPDVAPRPPIREDNLVHNAGDLVRYVRSCADEWWCTPEEAARESALLLRSLGNGILSFLQADITTKRVVTKSPSVRNIGSFFDLFPNACILIAVRDGRSVVESALRSWTDLSADDVAHEWADGARDLLTFLDKHADNPRAHVVRYERLLTELDVEVERLLQACNLDRSRFDLAAARALPLRGSSTDRGGAEKLHWDPVARPASFGGLVRWSGWSDDQHRRFNAIAGAEMRAFGYDLREVPEPPSARGVGRYAHSLRRLNRFGG
jgi:Sulfotransferase family